MYYASIQRLTPVKRAPAMAKLQHRRRSQVTTKLRQEAENLFGAAALAMHDVVLTAFDALDLRTTTDAAALILLMQSGKLSIGTLAELLDLAHSSMVRVGDRLVRRSLVTRDPDPVDARRAVLALTPVGLSLAVRALEVRRKALATMLRPLDQRETEAIRALLSKILTNHTTGRRSADRLCRLCDEESCGGDQCPVERAAISKSAHCTPLLP
jgi:MarR family transcriptional regulator, negative regulator of the multidrug operon emrRAB